MTGRSGGTRRVDNISLLLKLPFWIYGYSVGFGMWFLFLIMISTCRVRYVGREKLTANPNHIFACWHFLSFALLALNARWKLRGFSIINHPAWYMKHVHVLLRLSGVDKIYLGSSGDEGRQAVDSVAFDLKNGASTFINPDGPYGPEKVLKKGVLYMSANSGVPIVPIRIEMSSYFNLRSWDRKRVPLPFSRIDYIYGDLVWVKSSDEMAEKARVLTAELGP